MMKIHVLNERREGRKKEASKIKQTNKAKQHSTPKAVTFTCTCMSTNRCSMSCTVVIGRTCNVYIKMSCICAVAIIIIPPA